MRVLALLLMFAPFLGCTDPASLTVNVDIEVSSLTDVRITLTQEDGGRDVVECRSSVGTRAGGQAGAQFCRGPLEGGSGPWDGGPSLRFVVFGDPSTSFKLDLEGLRGDFVATSTSVETALPGRPGDNRDLDLVLVGRTSVSVQCDVDLSAQSTSGPVNHDSVALTVANIDRVARPEILAFSEQRLSILRYAVDGNECAFDEKVRTKSLPDGCELVPDSVVVGLAGPGSAPTADPAPLVGLCREVPGSVGPRAFLLELPRVTNAPIAADFVLSPPVPLALARPQYSHPVITHTGQGGMVVNLVYVGTDEQVFLGRWSVDGDPRTWSPLVLPGLQPRDVGAPMPGPIVFPARNREPMVVADYPGGIALVADGQVRVFQAPSGNPLRAAVAVALPRRDGSDFIRRHVISLYASGLYVSSFLAPGGQVMMEGPLRHADHVGGLSEDPWSRIAVGPLRDDGRLWAVVADEGRVHMYGLSDTGALTGTGTVTSHKLWENHISGAQSVLLANIDGRPGVELLGFDRRSPHLYALASGGSLFQGWPILGPEGGALHVLLANLQRPGHRRVDLEVLVLSGGRLRAFGLGPGSYDSRMTPWPFPHRDGARRGVYTSESAPEL